MPYLTIPSISQVWVTYKRERDLLYFCHILKPIHYNTAETSAWGAKGAEIPDGEQLHSTEVKGAQALEAIRSECHALICFAKETKCFMNNGKLPFRITPIFLTSFSSPIRKVYPWQLRNSHPPEAEKLWHVIDVTPKRLRYQLQVQDAMNWHLQCASPCHFTLFFECVHTITHTCQTLFKMPGGYGRGWEGSRKEAFCVKSSAEDRQRKKAKH